MSNWFRCSTCGQGLRKDGQEPPTCPRCGGKMTGQTDFLTLPPELQDEPKA